MTDSHNNAILEQGLVGYALHELILDVRGKPIDYKFLNVNKQFEILTGLKASAILGRSVRQVLPGIENSKFNWIQFYGNVALNGGKETFEQFSEHLNKWYRVEVISRGGNLFATHFIDITDQHKLRNITLEFNRYTLENIDYQKITDYMLEFSGAWLVSLNKFDVNGRDFITTAISGLSTIVSQASQLLGFNIIGKHWDYDPVRETKIKEKKTTFFENLDELTGQVIPKELVVSISKVFSVGQIALVKTEVDGRMVGDFTLVFKKDCSLQNRWLTESYADIVGMLLGRINAEEKLKQRNQQFLAIAAHTPDHIIMHDQNLRYTLVVNPQLGLTEKEMLGKTDLELIGPGDGDKLMALKKNVMKTRKPLSVEVPLENLKGETEYFEGSFIPTFNENKEIDGIIGYFRNITERKLQQVKLEEAIRKAEESERLKSAFLANMSHEIRTPMNGILGFTELLKDPDLNSEEKHKYIQIIERGGDRLLAIINNIISLSKIEAGQIDVRITETNLIELIEFLQNFFKIEAESKGLEIKIKTSFPSGKCIVKTDAEKVYAILTNLIKNAIKFTREGFIEIGCHQKEGAIEIYVKDTGIGVPKEQKDLIFERFQKSTSSAKGAYEGAGLGLSISKAYIGMLNGKIWLNNRYKKGTAIHFTLPGQL